MSGDGLAGTSAERRGGFRVGYVAADPLRTLGLQAIFEEWRDETGSAKATLASLTLPEVLADTTTDLVMIDARGTEHLFVLVETLRRARPALRMIVIGDSDEEAYIQRVIGAGAKGYLTRVARESEIQLAIEIVRDGSVWAPRKVLARLLDGAKAPSGGDAESEIRFTDRETEVLRLLGGGYG